MTAVLDTSALLALLFHEPGADNVAQRLGGARVSTVNLAEFATKLVDKGYSEADAQAVVLDLPVAVASFDLALAVATGLLRRATRSAGLSLGDRACLALAQAEGLPAVTADRAWADLDLGVAVEVVR